jgi:hypothetical protein
MSIWVAAAAIIGVAAGAFTSVLAKMVYKELRDARKRPTQLPLPPMTKTKEEKDERVHATV